eukprot:5836574-Amphidinium_carterae.1
MSVTGTTTTDRVQLKARSSIRIIRCSSEADNPSYSAWGKGFFGHSCAEVLTPEGLSVESAVSEAILPSSSGQLGVLANHAPMMTALDIGVLRYKKDCYASRTPTSYRPLKGTHYATEALIIFRYSFFPFGVNLRVLFMLKAPMAFLKAALLQYCCIQNHYTPQNTI